MKLKKQTIIKSIITLVIVSVFVSSPSYAADPLSCPTDMTWQLSQLLNIILSLLSWVWIVVAMFAWKLMSNEFIYASAFWVDKVLYYLRNISRVFANFLIAGIILYELVQHYFKRNQAKDKTLASLLIKLALGGLLINLSRFWVGVIVDLSTITTTAVGSLPNTYVERDWQHFQNTVVSSIMKNRNNYKLVLNLSSNICGQESIVTPYSITGDGNEDTTIEPWQSEAIMDKILPNPNNFSGPLVYFWSSVLHIQDYLYNSNNPKAFIDNLFVISVRLAIVGIFTIAMIFLVVINVFRIIIIWLAAAFGPIFIVLFLTNKTNVLWKRWEELKLIQIIKAIFAPTVAIGLLWVGLIAVTMLQSRFIHENSVTRWDSYITMDNKWSYMGVNGVFDVGIGGDILWKPTWDLVKNTFFDLILIAFAIFILWATVLALRKFLSKSFGSKTFNQMGEATDTMIWSMRVVPTPRGRISPRAAKNIARDAWLRIGSYANASQRDADTKIANKFRSWAGLPTHPTSKDYRELTKLKNHFRNNSYRLNKSHYDDFMQKSRTLISNTQYNKQKLALQSLVEIPSVLEAFLKNLATNKIRMRQFGSRFDTPLTPREDNDTLSSFIQKNYPQHREFFEKLYEDIWWDATKLRRDGRDYLTKHISWK